MKAKKIFIQSIPYLFVSLYATKLGEAWRLAEGLNASQKLLHLLDGFSAAEGIESQLLNPLMAARQIAIRRLQERTARPVSRI